MVRSLRLLAISCLVIFLPHLQAIALDTKSASTVSQIPLSIRDTAEIEIKTPPASASHPKFQATTGALSTEQTATMLQLEDPFEAPRLRDFEWGFGFFVSSQKPQGMVEVSGVGTQDLSSLKSSMTPSFSLGTLYGLTEGQAGTFEIGGEAEFGFASQESTLKTASGSQIDGRVNSSLIDGRLLVRWGSGWKSKFHGRLGMGIGRYTVTQTSDNSLGRWSKEGSLNTYLIGVDYKLGKKWLAQVNYRDFGNRGAFPEGLQVPPAFVELGAQIVW